MILYLGRHDHQRAMAEQIAYGAKSVLPVDQHGNVQLQTIDRSNFTDVLDSDAITIGSPVIMPIFTLMSRVSSILGTWTLISAIRLGRRS